MITYSPGQRWVSDTESELGLGIVSNVENRRVTVSFPAAGEERTYAADNAPLSRVEYQIGEEIANADEQKIKIIRKERVNDCVVYFGNDEAETEIAFHEIDLNSFVQFSNPQERLLAGQIDSAKSFELRFETLMHQHRHRQSSAFGLVGGRVQLLPHQFFIAAEVAARFAPRVLLADEVGLGKTIEAGLIMHQRILCGRASRVMIVVPDSLIHQWLVEMLRRFNLHFSILDEEACAACEESQEGNPFESAQLILCSLSFLTRNETIQAQALAASWDMLIVDEAHHLHWEEGKVSPEYAFIASLAQVIPSVLLLTATPEQLGPSGHFARLALLDPDRYYDLSKFLAEEETYETIGTLVEKLMDTERAEALYDDAAFLAQLKPYFDDAYLRRFSSDMPDEAYQAAVAETVGSLLDRHGTGRVLFRNTRQVVAGFPQRQLHLHALTTPQVFLEASVKADIEALLKPEQLLGEQWWLGDPRVAWLVEYLGANTDEKMLVICAQAATAQALEEYLRARKGIRSAVFHEGMSLVVRDRAAAYFAEEEDDSAQVLICSEIGSEGRNFQFAHHLVLFDVPLNPDLLEQRIGRLDRIGQTTTVNIHCLFYRDTAQEILIRWYNEGLDAFARPFPAGHSLYQEFREVLAACLTDSTDQQALEELIAATRNRAKAVESALQAGRNRLLELSSCDSKRAAEIIGHVAAATQQLELQKYMERVFDRFGVDQQIHGVNSVILAPSDEMISHSFPGLPEDGVTATFHRAQALAREDMQFLTWEHPMTQGAMDLIIGGQIGNTAVATIKLSGLKAGTLVFEAVYTPYCAAPRALQLPRYISAACVHVVVDSQRRDLSEVLTHERINQYAQRVPIHTARALMRQARQTVVSLVQLAQELADKQTANLIEQAIEVMRTEQVAERERLVALAKVNTNIRSEEIEFIDETTLLLEQHLRGMQLKFDAVRVLLAT